MQEADWASPTVDASENLPREVCAGPWAVERTGTSRGASGVPGACPLAGVFSLVEVLEDFNRRTMFAVMDESAEMRRYQMIAEFFR